MQKSLISLVYDENRIDSTRAILLCTPKNGGGSHDIWLSNEGEDATYYIPTMVNAKLARGALGGFMGDRKYTAHVLRGEYRRKTARLTEAGRKFIAEN